MLQTNIISRNSTKLNDNGKKLQLAEISKFIFRTVAFDTPELQQLTGFLPKCHSSEKLFSQLFLFFPACFSVDTP